MKHLLLKVLVSIFVVAALGQPAWAHKVIASVYASGDMIEGEIGFSNGDMAKDTTVEVFDENGTKIGEAQTDDDGFFTYKPTAKVVHVFRANLGAGHVAEIRMEVDELPDAISGSETADSGAMTAQAAGGGSAAASEPAGTPAPVGISDDVLKENREAFRKMLHKEVNPLRREIAAYKEKNNLQTILGGIGYIVGLFGIGFYIAARRRLAKA
ncbi:cobalt ABC transporter permease [uncultured Roseibium sp.]|uniref:cobalt ABC transporter permease n=1 Tax=uncultured Roseibium sp. TaxID=1936171 RepID=UPI0032164ED5